MIYLRLAKAIYHLNVSILLGIKLHGSINASLAWLSESNPIFFGDTPADWILVGKGKAVVGTLREWSGD